MSIILQHFEADIPELVGTKCERFLCMQFKHADGTIVPGFLWLKTSTGSWHRFFMDAWCLFWRERDEYEDESGPDSILDDLGSRYGLEGAEITGITMRQTPEDEEFDACLKISFADGRALVMQHSEEPARDRLTITNVA